MSLPLEGIRVVDLTQMVSGPMATMILADQGADVVKVEPPGAGDLTRAFGGARRGLAPLFAITNRGKRSLVLNLREARGRALLERLVARTDLFVQNFRPGTAERMGIGEAALRRVRPDLVYVSISGFGEVGPYAARRVYDPVIQALSGLADIQRDAATGRPRMLRLIVPDKVTALTAAQAMTAALLRRERTREGTHVRVSMLGATLAFLWPEGMAAHTFVGGGAAGRPPRTPELLFETADGHMTAGAVSDAEWEGLARALGHAEWLEDARFSTPAGRMANADARLGLVAEALRARPTAEWMTRFEAAGVPCAPVLTREQVLDDAQVRASQLVVESIHPHAGAMRQPRPAARFGEAPAEPGGPAPLLGEHSDALLQELGASREEIARWRAEGVVG